MLSCRSWPVVFVAPELRRNGLVDFRLSEVMADVGVGDVAEAED